MRVIFGSSILFVIVARNLLGLSMSCRDIDVDLSGANVRLDFPTFNDSLWYDPTVSSGSGSSGGGGSGGQGDQPDPMVSESSKVEFVGAAPKFKYFKDKDSNDFLIVDFKQISELDDDGSSVRSLNGWASKDFVWTRETIVNDDDDVEITKVTLSLEDVSLGTCDGGSDNGDTGSFAVECYMPKVRFRFQWRIRVHQCCNFGQFLLMQWYVLCMT